ncbi:Hsp70 family protein [Rhodococcus hoagii]|uniref:Hsp70 family protein n=1 Tax=Rhodococcus hoagii TaxID=43767 RepID=A0AAE2WAW3_RHOHA|nr:Hsp70 family protein [Prescottella equi]
MTAKDKGTGKENRSIQDGSGLSKEEIDRMIKDAGRTRRRTRTAARRPRSATRPIRWCHRPEKFIKDNEDKVPTDVKEKVEAAITEVKTALAGTDIAAVKAAVEKLSTESQALGQAIYDAQAADSAAGDGAGQAQDGDVVDAEVVDEPTDQDKK